MTKRSGRQRMSEKERLKRLAESDSSASENPRYRDLTPGKAVKILLSPPSKKKGEDHPPAKASHVSNLDVKMRSRFRDWFSPFKFENGISEDRLPVVRDFLFQCSERIIPDCIEIVPDPTALTSNDNSLARISIRVDWEKMHRAVTKAAIDLKL